METDMHVLDVMTRTIISVAPEDSVEAAVTLMLQRGISGLLVVDAQGDLVGIVTAGDLLRREELGTQRHRSWWLRLLASPTQQATDFVHAHGRHVRDVMTASVVTVPGTATLEEVVSLMERHGIKRVPVTEDRRVIGIVSRSDLLRALIGRQRHAAPLTQDDREIRARILDALEAQPWAPTTTLNITVCNGVVDLWGTISHERERQGIRIIAENAAGVGQVNDHLVIVEPYSGTVIEAPEPSSRSHGRLPEGR
jgi:CBS domain-containing protein